MSRYINRRLREHRLPKLPTHILALERQGIPARTRTYTTPAQAVALVRHRLQRYRFRVEVDTQFARLWVTPWVGERLSVWVTRAKKEYFTEANSYGPVTQLDHILARRRTRRIVYSWYVRWPLAQQADCWAVVLPRGGCLVLPRRSFPSSWQSIRLRADKGRLWDYWERWDVLLTLPHGVPPDLQYRISPTQPRSPWNWATARRAPAPDDPSTASSPRPPRT